MGIELNAFSNSFSSSGVESGDRNLVQQSKNTKEFRQEPEPLDKLNGRNQADNDKAKVKSAEELRELVDEVNQNQSIRQRNLEFSVNDEIGTTIVKVIDSESGELIRQIPSEELVRLAEKLSDQRQETGNDSKSSAGFLINSTI